jgi:FK506-binding protein 4/5
LSLFTGLYEKERAPWEMSNHEKIEVAGRKKEEGNLLFKKGKYHRAGKKYDKVISSAFSPS